MASLQMTPDSACPTLTAFSVRDVVRCPSRCGISSPLQHNLFKCETLIHIHPTIFFSSSALFPFNGASCLPSHMALPHILSVAQSYRSYHWSMFNATPSPDLHSELQHRASTCASKLGHLALILQINPLKPKFDQATEPYKNLQFFHRT